MRIDIKYLLLILSLVCSFHLSGNELKRGLSFRSFDVDKDQRTCLNLTPDKPLALSGGFSMEFDINLKHYKQNFGYIFRIISSDTLNIDLLANLDSETANFSLIVKGKTIIKYVKSEIERTIEDTWIKVLLTIDSDNDNISLSLDGVKKEAIYPLNHINRFDIYFGGNTHDLFSTTDIAPMTVRDIRILDKKQHLIRYWKLDAHGESTVYDECVHAKATVANPQWEIDNHIRWRKEASFSLSGTFFCPTFDEINDRIFIVQNQNIFIYNTRSQTIDTIDVRLGIPYNAEYNFNQVEYNPVKDELISYQFTSNHLAVFNFQTKEWSNRNPNTGFSFYTHHSNYYMANDSLLITVGGYGYHRYRSVLFKYSLAHKAWEEHNLSAEITPRYLGSMGDMEEKKILYFGGFGNESGRQEESPRNYYDLFCIDVDSMTVKKIWELPNPEEHFTNSNSMVIDKNNRKFYTLSYPNQRYASLIKLHEYSLDEPTYRVIGDSIPYSFNDIDSYCDLFLSSDGSELYAVTSCKRDAAFDVNVYSIAFPPMSTEEVIQPVSAESNSWIWLLTGLLIGGAGAFFLVRRKRQLKKKVGFDRISANEEIPIRYEKFFEEKKPSSINLLGNFQVVDTNGNDITHTFTPTTTQLFLLFLMSTVKEGKGITSQKLKRLLWPDKNNDSARNNRNVYINKLRSILKSFEDIKVVKNEGYWTIQSEENVFCDYEKTMMLMKMLQADDRFNVKLLTELVDIALRGTLLPDIQLSEWIESYQSDFTNQLIECLLEHSKNDEVKADPLLLLKMADVIQLHDNIDEDAIKIKCHALFRLGKKNQALQAFNKFTADYEYLLAAKHNLVFEELVM